MGSTEQIILDTHVFLWWISNPEKIPTKTSQKIESAVKSRNLFVSSISIWEIFMLVKGKRLQLVMDTEEWLRKVQTVPYLRFISIDNIIASLSVMLPLPLHDDPADRIIIATAIHSGALLITKDKKILSYSPVKTFWG